MLKKQEVIKAKQVGTIDVQPWRPDIISEEGKITLHLAKDVILEPAPPDKPFLVDGETEEKVRTRHYPFNIENDLTGYLSPEILPGSILGGNRIKIEIGTREVIAPGYNDPIPKAIPIPISYIGTERKKLTAGTPVASIYFEPFNK